MERLYDTIIAWAVIYSLVFSLVLLTVNSVTVEILQYVYTVYSINFSAILIMVCQIFYSPYFQKRCYIMFSKDKFANVLQWKFLFQL